MEKLKRYQDIDTWHRCVCIYTFCVCVCDCRHVCAISHVKVRGQSQVSSFIFHPWDRISPSSSAVSVKQVNPQASWVSPISASHLFIETLGLQMLTVVIWLWYTFWGFELRSLYFSTASALTYRATPQPTAWFFYSNKSSFQGLASDQISASCSFFSFPQQLFPLH